MFEIKAYKEKQFIIFDLEDGKTVKYNLSTGECIGKLGKPVKGLQSQLRGNSIENLIASFEDKNYSEFLSLIYVCCEYEISNIGTLLAKLQRYPHIEQIYSAGLRVTHPDFRYKINDIPKPLIRFCKEHQIALTSQLVSIAKDDMGLFQIFESEEFTTLGAPEFKSLMTHMSVARRNRVFTITELIETYNYKPKSLLKYIDKMMTYEALGYSFVSELLDYLRMMSAISPKFDKYPKNFLTTHRIAIRNYERLRKEYSEEMFKLRINPKLEYRYGDYRIIYPKAVQDIKDEAVSMNHCVASYIDNVIDGATNILFLRKANSPDKSLVTLEVVNNRVVQARRSFNHDPSPEERDVIRRYENYLQNKGEKEDAA